MELPSAYLDILDAPVIAMFAVVLPSGGAQVAPVWFLRDGDDILVSSVGGRHRERNVRANPHVAVTVLDPADSGRYIEVRGTATVTDDPTAATRDAVCAKHGVEGASFDRPGTPRVTIRVTPTRVIEH